MSSLDRAAIRREWTQSIDRLAQILGAPVSIGSIPGGAYSRAVAEAAAEAGLRALFTSEPVTRTKLVDGCLVVGRYTLRRNSSAQLASKIARAASVPRASQWLRWNAAKIAKAVGGQTYLYLRRALFDRVRC